jgi:peptidyl-prolyl cis-trans isomerase B (cyclophilin B)
MKTPVSLALTLLMLAVTSLAEEPRPSAGAATSPSRDAPQPAVTEVEVETSEGTFAIRLLPDLAPLHVKHFLKTARAGGYDGTTFHRLIAGGVIQGGDPLTKDAAKTALYGTGGLGLLRAEFTDRVFARGVVAAVRRPSSVNSAGSQFFVVLREQPSLKGQYTIFGEVVEGMDVCDRISLTPVDGDRAKVRVEMKVRVRQPKP